MKFNYEIAFAKDRRIVTEEGLTIFNQYHIGDLKVPTGFVTACDPPVNPECPPFKTPLPVGKYPVILSAAMFGTDERIAFARLQISGEWASRWEMAVLPGQDAVLLAADEIFGYPVDSGTGCFTDAETARTFAAKLDEDEDYADFMLEEMDKNYTHTRSWASFDFEETKGNLIAFSSGYGDGYYASYFGFDANGKLAALVTDFGLFEKLEYESYYDDFK